MVQMTRMVLTASLGLALSGGSFAVAPTVSTEDVVDKIDSPWDMAFMKDGTMFFTEKCKGLPFDFLQVPLTSCMAWAPPPGIPRRAPTCSATDRRA